MPLFVLKGEIMIEERIFEALKDEITKLGYSYLKVSFLKDNGNDVLRIIVDKDEPTSLEDIIKVNDIVSPIVDKLDLIKGRYMLDVTTLGVEKPISIDNLEKYISKYISVHLSNPFKGMNNMEGYLKDVTKEEIILTYQDKARKIDAKLERRFIDKARLAIKL